MHTENSRDGNEPSITEAEREQMEADRLADLASEARASLEALTAAWREHATTIAVARDAWRKRADRLAQLLTPAAAIAGAYVDRVHQPDLRDEALTLLEEIRRLPR